ncbi:hypothetical protein OG21DRAFT_1476603 [Imleria badia]|nr:hypothetical protein OG21DRAFT_1476603 [Imleria badia]
MILTDVHLLESRVYRGIGNFTKTKAALTSARTTPSSIYCPPHLQAALDLQSGVLHAEDKNYSTAYSYSFKNMTAQDNPSALTALKYILLCKVMLNLPEDVTLLLLYLLISLKYVQLREFECVRAIAIAQRNRDLAEFEKDSRDYKDGQFFIIRSHLAALYDIPLQQNLLRG